MHLDVTTTLLVSGIITAGMGLATLFYSLARKENRPLLWAAAASGGYALCMFLAGFRGRIPDFFSIVVCNELLLFYMVAYYEAFCRLFSARPKARYLGPLLLGVQFLFFLWFTYQQPDFQARLVVISVFTGVMCLATLKLILTNLKRVRAIVFIFAVLPFTVLLLISLMNVLVVPFSQALPTPSFDSSLYALAHAIYCICAIWITLAVLFIVSDRLQTQVIQMSLTDPLTGTLNRRALEYAAKREMARSARKGHPLSVIMTDLDRFKEVNDNYGHQAGDALLAHAVTIYLKNLRAEDVLARYGGDELVVLLPDADLPQALSIAERMRVSCRDNLMEFEGRRIPLTCSFGIAVSRAGESDWESLIKHADRALYQAKEDGGDKVVVSGMA